MRVTLCLICLILSLSAVAKDTSQASDNAVRQAIIEQSIQSYSGNCPCPYNSDRAGRRCGKRSAYSRPGGASPMCYKNDVSTAAVERYRKAL